MVGKLGNYENMCLVLWEELAIHGGVQSSYTNSDLSGSFERVQHTPI